MMQSVVVAFATLNLFNIVQGTLVDKSLFRTKRRGSSPGLPTSLAVYADQCKCKFIGACTCQASVQFMDCIADACASGDCDCHDMLFHEVCQDMAATCPSSGLQCSTEKAICVHHQGLNTQTEDELRQELVELKKRKCKLERAHKAGYINADNRLHELEPEIHARLDALKRKAVDLPYMGCGPAPIVAMSPDKDNATKIADINSEDAKNVAVADGEHSLITDRFSTRFKSALASVLIYILLTIIFAFIYNRYRRTAFARDQVVETVGQFKFGLFSCFGDLQISMLAFCCPTIRWADTLDKANDDKSFLSYWTAVLVMMSIVALHLFITHTARFHLTGAIVLFVLIGLGFEYRQRLRKKYNIPAARVEDCLAWTFCSCCAIVQEARQVEASRNHDSAANDYY